MVIDSRSRYNKLKTGRQFMIMGDWALYLGSAVCRGIGLAIHVSACGTQSGKLLVGQLIVAAMTAAVVSFGIFRAMS